MEFPAPRLYLIRGETKEIVRKYLNSISYSGSLYQVTWEKLSLLTGCIIPKNVGHQEAAFGDLVFNRSGSIVIVLGYICLGGE